MTDLSQIETDRTVLRAALKTQSQRQILDALEAIANNDDCPSIVAANRPTFMLAYLTSFIAGENYHAEYRTPAPEPEPLTEDQVREYLLSVNYSRLLSAREAIARRDELVLEVESPWCAFPGWWCAFPGCPNERTADDLFCEAHVDDDDDGHDDLGDPADDQGIFGDPQFPSVRS